MFVIYEAELGNSSPCVLFKKCMSGNEEREEASIDAQHGRLESNGRLTRQEDPCATNNDVSTQEQFDTTKEGKNRCLCYEEITILPCPRCRPYRPPAVPSKCQKTPTRNAAGQPH